MKSVMINKENIYRNVPEVLKMTFDPYSIQMLKESDIPSDDTLPEPDYVDLGLPSGTLWAKMNLGATSETDNGLYYAWGETQGYTEDQIGNGEGLRAFSWNDYKWGTLNNLTKYSGANSKLSLEDDAAYQVNETMRMPSVTLLNELASLQREISSEGVTFIGNNGNRLFFPFSGYYRNGEKIEGGYAVHIMSNQTSTYFSNTIFHYYTTRDSSGYNNVFNDNGKCYGCPVRAVRVNEDK